MDTSCLAKVQETLSCFCTEPLNIFFLKKGNALPRAGNPAKTLPRTEEWKLKHTLSLKTGGRWLLVFLVTARITSSCHVAASCVFGVWRNWTAGPNIRSRATPLSWAELGGETHALKVSFHLEESLSLDSHPPAYSFRTSPTWKWPCASGWQTPNLLRLLVTLWSPAWPCGRSSRLLLLWYGPLRLIWKKPVSVARRCKL